MVSLERGAVSVGVPSERVPSKVKCSVDQHPLLYRSRLKPLSGRMEMLELLMKWLGDHVLGLQGVSYIVTILGLPVFIVQYYRNSRRENIARTEKIYESVDTAFVDFNKLIVNYPHLNVTWYDVAPRTLSDDESTQRYIIFDLLTNMFERAFLIYADAASDQKKEPVERLGRLYRPVLWKAGLPELVG